MVWLSLRCDFPQAFAGIACVLPSYLACGHYLGVCLFHAYFKRITDIKHHKIQNIIQLTLNKLSGNLQQNKNKNLVVINLCVPCM